MDLHELLEKYANVPILEHLELPYKSMKDRLLKNVIKFNERRSLLRVVMDKAKYFKHRLK